MPTTEYVFLKGGGAERSVTTCIALNVSDAANNVQGVWVFVFVLGIHKDIGWEVRCCWAESWVSDGLEIIAFRRWVSPKSMMQIDVVPRGCLGGLNEIHISVNAFYCIIIVC